MTPDTDSWGDGAYFVFPSGDVDYGTSISGVTHSYGYAGHTHYGYDSFVWLAYPSGGVSDNGINVRGSYG